WVDPMHPAYKSDRPGIAPDCGMKLQPVYEGSGTASQSAQRKILYYRDPKDASYHSGKPGRPRRPGTVRDRVSEGARPAGTVQIAADEQQLIGVRYATAELSSGAG